MLPGSTNHQIARAAGTMMIAFVLSQVLGLVRSILMTRAFGTGAEADAFTAATRLSDILFNLVAGGALASAFVPTFTGFLTKEDRAGAWKLASAVANLVVLILTGLAALSAVFAPWIVRTILAPDFPPAEQALTVSLLRVILPSAVVFGVSGLLMGVLKRPPAFLPPRAGFLLDVLAGNDLRDRLADPLAGHFWTGLGGAGGRRPAPAHPDP